MSAIDRYRVTVQFDSTSLQAIVTRLEVRGEHPYFAKMLEDYLDAMHVDTANSVLDLDCGTGVATHWDMSQPPDQVAPRCAAPIAWLQLAESPVWPGGRPDDRSTLQ